MQTDVGHMIMKEHLGKEAGVTYTKGDANVCTRLQKACGFFFFFSLFFLTFCIVLNDGFLNNKDQLGGSGLVFDT